MKNVQWIDANSGYPLDPQCSSTFGARVDSVLTPSRNGHFNISGVRRLLSNAPVCKEGLPAHGYLLSKLLFKVGDEIDSRYVLSDAKLLAIYLRAIINMGPGNRPDIFIPNQGAFFTEALMLSNAYSDEDPCRKGLEFIRGYLRAVLREETKLVNSLHEVMSSLITSDGFARGHPVLCAMTSSSMMEPTGLMHFFHEKQFDYKMPPREDNKSGNIAAYALFLKALRPVIVDTQWQPKHEPHIELLWDAHGMLQKKSLSTPPGVMTEALHNTSFLPAREALFIKAMMHGQDRTLHYALEYITSKIKIDAVCLDTLFWDVFFPLPLKHCVPKLVLLHLLQLAGDVHNGPAPDKTVEFMNRLGYHHPQVFALLNIQLNLYPEVAVARQHVDGMIDAFNRTQTQNEKHVDSLELPDEFDLINV